jgi:(4S)-4-hydroxy-5-phosphonooxypentane-2,3-dione isomerase
MLVNLVHIHVKPEYMEEFIKISVYNAENSRNEPGVARFDLVQQKDDPTRFVFIEVFKNEGATEKHRETEHYQKWRSTVADMMAEPRSAVRCTNLSPDDSNWG